MCALAEPSGELIKPTEAQAPRSGMGECVSKFDTHQNLKTNALMGHGKLFDWVNFEMDEIFNSRPHYPVGGNSKETR